VSGCVTNEHKGRSDVTVTHIIATIQVSLMAVGCPEEIKAELAMLKPSLATEYNVCELGIFGSYARDEQTGDSDLDVLVRFEEPVTLFELVRLENELTTKLGVDVDLVTEKSLKPAVRTRVTEDVVYV